MSTRNDKKKSGVREICLALGVSLKSKPTKVNEGLYKIRPSINGKRSTLYFKSQAAAEEFMEKINEEIRVRHNRHNNTKENGPKFIVILDEWLSGTHKIKENTKANYRRGRECLKPLFDKQLFEIQENEVALLFKTMATESPWRLNPMYCVLANVDRYARETLRTQGLQFNVKSLLRLVPQSNERMLYFTQLELSQVIQYAMLNRSAEFYNALILLAVTGLRIGEALALSWDDIDLETGRISVSKTVVGNGKTKFIQPSTKSGRNRKVPLIGLALNALTELKALAGSSSFVITTSRSRRLKVPAPADWFRRELKACRPALGENKSNFFIPHALRHTYATAILCKNGDEPGAAMRNLIDMMGHKTPSMAMKYAHAIEDKKKKAVDAAFSNIVIQASAEPPHPIEPTRKSTRRKSKVRKAS